ncbi:hypothetical protein NC653_019004 [Populus alba x Populus x berolinensis]|uniref:Uncharacterized protein n=1 Tax=Populus alba x Populus x berolinensis TaxID=444605 RepID=A0AAD6QHR6_9ROSI|nr:hypothetical protein NC653_019004 [Populus alba x Populus x berolinensis]
MGQTVKDTFQPNSGRLRGGLDSLWSTAVPDVRDAEEGNKFFQLRGQDLKCKFFSLLFHQEIHGIIDAPLHLQQSIHFLTSDDPKTCQDYHFPAVSMWNRRDKQAGQRPRHCRYTPLIAPSTVMTVVASSSGAPPPAMFGAPYTDTAASMAMQPWAEAL